MGCIGLYVRRVVESLGGSKVPPYVCHALAIVLLVAAQAFAQTSAQAVIAGAVHDPLGGVVAGATVTLLRDDGSPAGQMSSDSSGAFTFSGLAPGRYSVRAASKGFDDVAIAPFYAAAGEHLLVPVMLQIGLVQHEVVTASASAVPASQVGAPVTVVDQATMAAMDTPDVSTVLRTVPGVATVQTGAHGGTTSLFIRGGASNFNKVLIDGVPANDIGGFVDFADYATAGVDRVEVLRDSNSVLYGSDALAGVVSVTTPRGLTRIPQASYQVEGGNFGTVRQTASFGGASRRVDYFVSAGRFATDNQVPNNKYRNTSIASRVGFSLGKTRVDVTTRASNSHYGLPNATEEFGIADDTTQQQKQGFVGVRAETALSDRWRNTATFGGTFLRYSSVNPSPTGTPFDPFGFGANYLGNTVTLTGANGYSVTGQAILDFGGTFPSPFTLHTNRGAFTDEMTYQVSHSLDLSGGVRLNHEMGFTLAPARQASARTNYGGFVEARFAAARTFVTGGLGLDHDAVFRFAATPRLSIAHYLREPDGASTVGSTKLTLNAGTGIKAPAIYQELSSLDALSQSTPSLAGKVAPIGPERSRTFDVGVEQGLWGERVQARVSFFNDRYSDLIEFVGTGVLPQLGIPADVVAASASAFGAYVNSSSHRARGVETSLDLRAGDWRLAASYTHVNAIVTKSLAGGALAPAINPAFPNISIGQFAPLVGGHPFQRPANSGTVMGVYTHGALVASVSAFVTGKADDSTFLTDGFFGTSLLLPNHNLDAGYTRVDAAVSYAIGPRIRADLACENLANARYHQVFGFPALSRAVRAGVTVDVGGSR